MQTLTQRLANPTRFMELSARMLPWISASAALVLAYGLYRAGRIDEAQAVARGALEREMDEGSRAYLRRFLELEPPSA